MKKLVSLLIILCCILSLGACGGKKEQALDWPTVGLATMLPDPPTKNGKILMDNEKKFMADIDNLDDALYKEYIQACKNIGFTIDSKNSSIKYEAHNSDGYFLRLIFSEYGKSMSVYLDAPIVFSAFRWPGGVGGTLVPNPNKQRNAIQWEEDDSFYLYIADMTIDEFNAYIDICANAGFNVDYQRGNDFYYAANENGFHLTLNYEGFNTVFVMLDKPYDEGKTEKPEAEMETSSEDKIENNDKEVIPTETKQEVPVDTYQPTYTPEVTQTPASIPTPTPTPTTTPEPTPKPKRTPTPPRKVDYSTNTWDTVRDGNKGVYAYSSRGGTYENIYIIDFDEGYVYVFTNGNGDTHCDKVKIVSGDLNDVVIITYHESGYVWSMGLCFKWKRQPDHLLVQINGFAYDFYTTDLDRALKIRETKKIVDYS